MSDQPKNATLWIGRALSGLPAVMFAFSAFMKLSHGPEVIEGFVGKFGFPEASLTPIGLVELACALLYVIPRTSVLGAILLTGYLGGAVVTHVRVGDVFIAPILVGVVVWLGLYFREPRLQALVPLLKAKA